MYPLTEDWTLPRAEMELLRGVTTSLGTMHQTQISSTKALVCMSHVSSEV